MNNLTQFMAKHGGSRAANRAAEEREAAMNGPTIFDPDLAVQLRIPTYVLYIYNVGPMEFRVSKGSAGPPGGYHIQACEKGKPYSAPLVIPSMVTDTYLQEDIAKTHSVTGEFMCQDIVHPALTDTSWSVGQNLDDFGVFWTKNKNPMPEELALAVAKMEKTFRAALAEANTLEATNRLDLITPLMVYAADHYEESRKWNPVYKRTLECPICGGPMKAGIAIHACGAVHDWPKAIVSSARSFDDAKKHGVYSELLEKQVAELRARLKAPEPEPAGDAGATSSFVTAAELQEFDKPEIDEPNAPALGVPTAEQIAAARALLAKHGAKPPKVKKPAKRVAPVGNGTKE